MHIIIKNLIYFRAGLRIFSFKGFGLKIRLYIFNSDFRIKNLIEIN